MKAIDKSAVRAARHRAVDVPALRDRLLEGWRDRGHLRQLLLAHPSTQMNLPTYLRDEAAGVNRQWTLDEWITWLVERVAAAELFYVTPDMTELITQASQAAPSYEVYRDRLPAETGLVVFGQPFCEVPPERLAPGQRVELNAFLWATVPDVGGGVSGPQPGVMVVTLQDTEVLLLTQPWDGSDGTAAQLQQIITAMRSGLGPLAYHEEYPMPFGDTPWGEPAGLPVNNAAVAAAFTTWILMGQRIATVEQEVLPRHVRKRAARAGRPEPKVRTVDMRRTGRAQQEQEQQPGTDPRKYTKRWVVKGYGYWRNTWYPSRERHELQYVHVPSYVKGPDGAPLVGGERVNVLRR